MEWGVSRTELSAVKNVWRVQQVTEVIIKFGELKTVRNFLYRPNINPKSWVFIDTRGTMIF